jgi:Aspartyl protease
MHRLTASALLLLVLATGCAQMGGHGPISSSTMQKLQSRSMSKADFLGQLQVIDPNVRSTLPNGKVSLPFDFKTKTPVIKAAGLDDQALSMLFDTGAARTVLGANTAVKNKVRTIHSQEAMSTMLGVVGNEQGLVGIIRPLRLGSWTLPAYPCFVRLHETFGEGIAYPSDILGFDLPTRYCSQLTFDYPNQRIILSFQESFKLRDGMHSASVPFSIEKGVPFVKVQAKGVTWSSLIDTGSFNGVEINEAVAKQLGVQDQGVIVEGLTLVAVGGMISSDKAKLRTVKLPEIKLLGGNYKQAEVDISPGPPRIGSYFLKDYRVTFDFRTKRLWLEW